MEAGKRVRSKAFLVNWNSSGGTRLLNLVTSACLPEKEEETAAEDPRCHATDVELRNLLQTYGNDLLIVPNELLLTKTQGVYLKAMKALCQGSSNEYARGNFRCRGYWQREAREYPDSRGVKYMSDKCAEENREKQTTRKQSTDDQGNGTATHVNIWKV